MDQTKDFSSQKFRRIAPEQFQDNKKLNGHEGLKKNQPFKET
jgi:hypothetical protein